MDNVLCGIYSEGAAINDFLVPRIVAGGSNSHFVLDTKSIDQLVLIYRPVKCSLNR